MVRTSGHAAATPNFSLDQTTRRSCPMAFSDKELSALLDSLSLAKEARSRPEDKEEQHYKPVGELANFLCADTSCRGPLLERSKQGANAGAFYPCSNGRYRNPTTCQLTFNIFCHDPKYLLVCIVCGCSVNDAFSLGQETDEVGSNGKKSECTWYVCLLLLLP